MRQRQNRRQTAIEWETAERKHDKQKKKRWETAPKRWETALSSGALNISGISVHNSTKILWPSSKIQHDASRTASRGHRLKQMQDMAARTCQREVWPATTSHTRTSNANSPSASRQSTTSTNVSSNITKSPFPMGIAPHLRLRLAATLAAPSALATSGKGLVVPRRPGRNVATLFFRLRVCSNNTRANTDLSNDSVL